MIIASSADAARDPWRRHVWIALLVGASVVLSLGFACAVPFAAFAGAAALTMPRREALTLSGGVWLANQIVGFGFLHYPWDATTLAWGVVLGAVTLLATVAAQEIGGYFRQANGFMVAGLAFAGAFVAYEGGLLVATLALGGMDAFAPRVVLQIGGLNLAGFVVLLIVDRMGRAFGLSGPPAFRLSPR